MDVNDPQLPGACGAAPRPPLPAVSGLVLAHLADGSIDASIMFSSGSYTILNIHFKPAYINMFIYQFILIYSIQYVYINMFIYQFILIYSIQYVTYNM